jgi:hypothetical protein
MESLVEMVVEKSGEFLAVGNRTGLVREILEDESRVVRAAKKGAIDVLRAALDEWTRGPNERNAEEGAESHAELRVTCEETREETRKKEYGEERAKEKKDVVASLNEDVTGTAAKEGGNFQDTVFNDRVGERKRVEEYEKRKK